jgi:hypothetical protein
MSKLRTLNPEQVWSAVRTIGQVVGSILVTKGWIADADWQLYSGAALVIVPTIIGLINRSDENLIKSAAEVPAVKEIVAPGTSVAGDPDYGKVKPL